MILNYFKSLSDETRIRLLSILIHFELSVNEIVALMDMGQSRISRHLKIMSDAGIISCRRDGIWAFYSAASKGDGKLFLDGIKFLFERGEIFQADLEKAGQVIEERAARSQKFFNEIAPEWNTLKNRIIGDFDLDSSILSYIDSCEMAVDLGCGTGEFLTKLKERSKYTVGVDNSPKMLEEARKLFNNSNDCVNLRLGELEHLPLSDSEADLAVISMALHHLSNPGAVISEVARIVKKGGTFIIADFDKHNNEEMRKTYGDRWLGFSSDEIEGFLGSNFTLETFNKENVHQSLKLVIYKAVRN
jgi:ArsR family transcriptional regulator